MQITQSTERYNDRRYGKPWIALVDFSDGAKGHFTFGEWCGQNGTAGDLYLDAEAGDIVALGQKDFRKPSNSAPDFHIVAADGSLHEMSKADAYKHWRTRQTTTEHAANARLIAAAPDLLAACKIGPLLRDAAIHLEANFADVSYALNKAADHIAAAITKAEGRPDPLDVALDACAGELELLEPND